MITIDKDLLLPTGEPEPAVLGELLRLFAVRQKHLGGLHQVYDRRHSIQGRRRLRGLPNNRLVHDLPGYIVTTAAGYLLGSPVAYAPPKGQEAAFEAIRQAYQVADSESLDAELAVDASVYGVAVELAYADEDAQPKVAQIDPKSAFVVYDDTVRHVPLLGVTILPKMDRTLRAKGERITVYTVGEAISYERVGQEQPRPTEERAAHFFGAVPLVEYWNNSREQGDFEPVLSLLDAYDALQSDRVNDKQQFTDSILAMYGVGSLGVEDAPTPTLHGMIQDMDTTKSKEVLSRFSSVTLVPQTRFYTSIEQRSGKDAEKAGGYAKAEDAKDINFMVIHRAAVIQFPKHIAPKVIRPELNQDADAWKFGYRQVGVHNVYANKLAGVYLHHKA